MKRAICFLAALVAANAFAAADGPPLASAWNIATTGSATSSGDLEFRITPNDGTNPVDISVPVISGANQGAVARSIGRSLSSQLRRDRYSVQVGENGNVLVSDPRGQPNFSLELVDSSIENVRVAVQSVTPAAPPTAPMPAAPPPANAPMSNPLPPPDATGGNGAPPSTPSPNAKPGEASAAAPPPTR
jgi:hypothetical protein